MCHGLWNFTECGVSLQGLQDGWGEPWQLEYQQLEAGALLCALGGPHPSLGHHVGTTIPRKKVWWQCAGRVLVGQKDGLATGPWTVIGQ